jgi:hypothetical protein
MLGNRVAGSSKLLGCLNDRRGLGWRLGRRSASGALTEAEFQAAKQKLLGTPN